MALNFVSEKIYDASNNPTDSNWADLVFHLENELFATKSRIHQPSDRLLPEKHLVPTSTFTSLPKVSDHPLMARSQRSGMASTLHGLKLIIPIRLRWGSGYTRRLSTFMITSSQDDSRNLFVLNSSKTFDREFRMLIAGNKPI